MKSQNVLIVIEKMYFTMSHPVIAYVYKSDKQTSGVTGTGSISIIGEYRIYSCRSEASSNSL